MIKSFYLIAMSLALLSCQPDASGDNNNQPLTETAIDPADLLTLSDAEKIVGEPAHLSDSSTATQANVLTYSCAYTANAEDDSTGKTGAVYFLFEHYANVASAQEKYTSIKTANENHEGIEVLDDVGDEAYFHTDRENFYFIMVRKGEKVISMKVNKITGTTSLDEFNRIAKKITDAL